MSHTDHASTAVKYDEEPRRAYKYRRRVPRTVGGKQKDTPRFPPTRTVLLHYPASLLRVIDTLGYQPSLVIIIRVSIKYRVALQLLGGFVPATRVP